jgi:hypothetical protein
MDRVVTYDHLGFGFSDKPVENYTYSLLDQAEQSLQLWRVLGRQGEELLLSLRPGGAVPSALANIR